MTTTSASIQALIDSKVALIAQIVATITTITASPKPDYSIDGQTVSWSAYLATLVNAQSVETDCLAKLYELQNIDAPYQMQSRMGGHY